jgi:sarcosine oxidase gamma subunit
MALVIRNAHARATVLSAVWSEKDHQLVACTMTGDKQSLTAIKAEMEKHNSRSGVELVGDEVRVELSGAQKGFVKMMATLEHVNAVGYAMTMMHHRAHDPRLIPPEREKDGEIPAPYFYVVAHSGQCLMALLAERLQLALPCAVDSAWAETLIDIGKNIGLVDLLPVQHSKELGAWVESNHFTTFQSAARVTRDETRWVELICSALKEGTLRFVN